MSDQIIRVLIVDDSSVSRMLLMHLLEKDPQILVIGTASDGQAAVESVHRSKPDVVLMDVNMPKMDGFDAAQRIMETQPVPIVICSAATNPKEVSATFRMVESGAVAFVEKPISPTNPHYAALAANLVQTVKLMSEVKVIRRWPRNNHHNESTDPLSVNATASTEPAIRVVGIGASTGGTIVLQKLLTELPKTFPVPILIVQHIAPGFLTGLVNWLNDTTGYRVDIAAVGVTPLPGHAYLAPDELHMGVSRSGTIALSTIPPENHLRPAVSYLFRSLLQFYGSSALGVLLTGMGRDGAEELKSMKDAGCITIAQDRDTSVVHGMPGTAIALGGATYVLPDDKMAKTIVEIVRSRNRN